MVSVANENGASESMQESETTCNSAALLFTENVSSFNSKPKEEQHEEEDDKEDSHEEEEDEDEEDCQEEEDDDEDGCEFSSNRRKFSGIEPDHKRFKACLGTVEDEGEEINSRLEILQTLVPGGYALDTVSLLEQTACYIKFLVQVVNGVKLQSDKL